eukprot:784433-Ditylum_brightwellii.AAC.1
MLICQLHNNGKPAHMRFNTYVACRQEWAHHLNSRYLNITIAGLTDQENVEAIFSHQPKCHQAKNVLEKEELMKLMAPKLLSSRISVTPSVLNTGRNPASQAAVLRAPTSTTLSNPMEAVVQWLIVVLATLMLLVMIAIAYTKTTINIAWAGTAMITAKTTTQAEIEITTAKAAAMPTKLSQ